MKGKYFLENELILGNCCFVFFAFIGNKELMEFGTGSITNIGWDTFDDDFDIEKTHFNMISSWATHKHTYTDIWKTWAQEDNVS